MKFVFTPDEAQSTAVAVVEHLKATRHSVSVEVAVDPDLPFRPTISARRETMMTYIEAQHAPAYTTGVRELVAWSSVSRRYCKVFIAVPQSASLSGELLTHTKRDGVGLMLVDDAGGVIIHQEARNPALVVTPEPTLALGPQAAAVKTLVTEFNDGQRKGALSGMCEVVEGETEKLANKLAKKAWLTVTPQAVEAMDWSSRINVIASTTQCAAGRSPVVDEKLKADLHSFRGARNLIDHPAATRAKERRRQIQFAERMLMGPRLVAELLAARRRVV